MKILLFFSLCFGILAGRNATTDGYVYLGHNEDQGSPAMLNIYNVPANDWRCSYLWFEFPGQKAGDSFVNEYGVGITSDKCKSREDKATGTVIYEVRTTVAQKARSSRSLLPLTGVMLRKTEGVHSLVLSVIRSRTKEPITEAISFRRHHW